MKTFPENINPDLIITFLCGEASSEDEILIKEWIALSDENKASFESLSKIWNKSKEAFLKPLEVDTDLAWQKVSARIEKSEIKTKSLFIIRYTLSAAAVLIPLLIVGYLYFYQFNNAKLLSFSAGDSISEKTLSDGSIIKLNRNSILQYPEEFAGKNRDVKLKGEAFFNITPDLNKPFIIQAENIFIKVVGTSFNVNAYPENEDISVNVISGKVLIYTENINGEKLDSLYLLAGDNGIYNKKKKKLEKLFSSANNDLYWMNKTLDFDGTEFSDVLKTLSSCYQVKFEVKKMELNKLHLSATFKNQGIDSILDIISTTLNISITKSDSIYIIDEKNN